MTSHDVFATLSWDSGARRLHHLPVSLAFLGFKAIYPVCNWDGLGVYAIARSPRLLAQREFNDDGVMSTTSTTSPVPGLAYGLAGF